MQAHAARRARLQVIGLPIAVVEACVCLGRGLATVENSDERLLVGSAGPS